MVDKAFFRAAVGLSFIRRSSRGAPRRAKEAWAAVRM